MNLGLPPRLSAISHLLWNRQLCSQGCCDTEGGQKNSIPQVVYPTSTISQQKGVSYKHQWTSGGNLSLLLAEGIWKHCNKNLCFQVLLSRNPGWGRERNQQHRLDQHGGLTGHSLSSPWLTLNTTPQAANAPSQNSWIKYRGESNYTKCPLLKS